MRAVVSHSKMLWCRRGESNPRPRDYETLALPLSYAGLKTIHDAKGSLREVSSRLSRWQKIPFPILQGPRQLPPEDQSST